MQWAMLLMILYGNQIVPGCPLFVAPSTSPGHLPTLDPRIANGRGNAADAVTEPVFSRVHRPY